MKVQELTDEQLILCQKWQAKFIFGIYSIKITLLIQKLNVIYRYNKRRAKNKDEN